MNNVIIAVMKLLKSAEDKRIEFLLHRYFEVLRDGQTDDTARLMVSWEFNWGRNGQMFKYLSGKSIEDQKKFLNEHVEKKFTSYDIKKLVAYIVSWEFPNKYNEGVDIDKIRTGTNALSILDRKIDAIYSKLKK